MTEIYEYTHPISEMGEILNTWLEKGDMAGVSDIRSDIAWKCHLAAQEGIGVTVQYDDTGRYIGVSAIRYPNYEDIAKVCAEAGGNTYDPISGATVFDIVKYNSNTGKIWTSPVIATDLDNRRTYRGDVHEVINVGANTITADDIISRIASYTCPSLQSTNPHCPANKYGMPMCHALPLCKHARAVKEAITVTIKDVTEKNTNPFYDPEKAQNGGGYYQPEVTVTLSNGGQVVIYDSSCGVFGTRYSAEYTNSAGTVLAEYSYDSVADEPYESEGFDEYPHIAKIVKDATGYNLTACHK